MPSRNDVYAGTKRLLTDAGFSYVYRGMFNPFDTKGNVVDSMFPLAAVAFDEAEQIEDKSPSHGLSGVFTIFIWIRPGDYSGGAGRDEGWKAVDDLHDNILRGFELAFDKGYFSNTTSLTPEDYHEFFSLTEEAILGSAMRVRFRLDITA